MEPQALIQRSYRNLRAYRRACALASDLFWITRRFPRAGQHTLTDQLRRMAEAVPEHIVRGWSSRHDACAFMEHLNAARQASDQLSHWLNVAKACQYLTPDEHEVLLARKAEVEQTILRLQQRCALRCTSLL